MNKECQADCGDQNELDAESNGVFGWTFRNQIDLLVALLVISGSEFDVTEIDGQEGNEQEQTLHRCIVRRDVRGEQVHVTRCKDHEEQGLNNGFQMTIKVCVNEPGT